MRNFDENLAAEIAKEIASTFFYIEFQFSSTHRYTDRDIPLYISGEKYLSRHFELSDIAYAANMTVDRMTIEFGNAELEMSAILLGEDVRNKITIVGCGALNANHAIIGTAELFRGILGDWRLSEGKAIITVVNEFILWKKKTLRICQSTCPWIFKETECGYSGSETWCDQSYDRCNVLGNALGNTAGFGGDRFLPSIAEKEIWWGRIPK